MKGSNFIWSICCELFDVVCALIPNQFLIISFVIISIAPFAVSYLNKLQQTKQRDNADKTAIEIKRIEAQARIKEMEIYKEMVLGIASTSPPEPEELEKHNHDNLLYFEDTAKKRMTQIISEPERDADRSLPAYNDNLKEDINNDTNGLDYKSMLQIFFKKDDNNET